MGLSSGGRIGPYQVLSVIGVGGMGEVYRATDTRLQRDVALKVLPAAGAGDHDRLSRFEREARLLASLNHANIASVHGIEESDGVLALAMEFIDGTTLAARLAQGPLPIDEAHQVLAQIAAALEAAHEAGVIHRDLKPANVMIRRDGTVKVLDFGLARRPTSTLAGAATGSMTTAPLAHGDFALTEPGIVLGTPAYMSPEQARGQEVDKRTDIWSFGCVFYEVLTGRPLFLGATPSDTIAAVLTREIDLGRLTPSVPGHWRVILRRCLDRDPRTRLRDIGEMRVALLQKDGPITTDPPSGSRRTLSRVAGWGLTMVLAGAGGAAMANWYQANRQAPQMAIPYRFQIATPTMLDLTDFAVSPDGRTLAFVALADEKVPAVWIRPFGAADATVLPGTEGARGVFWSPDSQHVGYAVSRQLYQRSLAGGTARNVTTLSGQFIGAAWWEDSIVFAVFPGGLLRVPAAGGEASVLTRPRSGDRVHGRPVFLGDGRLLFPVLTATGTQTCAVSIDGPEMRCVEASGALVGSIDSTHLLSLRGGSLMIERFDAQAMTYTGAATPVITEELHLRSAGNRAPVSYSSSGAIAFRPGAAEQRRLVWFDRSGRRGDVVATGSHDNFDVSADGNRILVAGTDTSGNDIVSVIDVTRGVQSRVVAGERGWANDPVWSPDGREFAYMQRGDRSRITARPVDGGADRTIYEPQDDDVWVEDWSRDGRYLAVGSSRGWREPRLLLVPVAGGTPVTVPAAGDIIDECHFSPDGKWLAYNSDASGRQEIYVTRLPGTGERWQVSSAGGVQPRWRGNGRELFYLAPDGSMMSVAIAPGQAFVPLAPRRLFSVPEGLGSPILDEYGVTADGQRFLVAEPIRARGTPPINVLVNWSPRLP